MSKIPPDFSISAREKKGRSLSEQLISRLCTGVERPFQDRVYGRMMRKVGFISWLFTLSEQDISSLFSLYIVEKVTVHKQDAIKRRGFSESASGEEKSGEDPDTHSSHGSASIGHLRLGGEDCVDLLHGLFGLSRDFRGQSIHNLLHGIAAN